MDGRDLRLEYSRALAGLDPERIVGTLSDEVTITVAAHDTPLLGKEVARFLFGLLGEELRDRNDLGLLSEEYDVDRACMCGNFPQAFTHLALVGSPHRLDAARRRAWKVSDGTAPLVSSRGAGEIQAAETRP